MVYTKELWKNKRKAFVNYFLLTGKLENVSEDNPFISVGMISNKKNMFRNSPNEWDILNETLKFLKGIPAGTLLIMEEPKIFTEVFAVRCNKILDKDVNQVLKKFKYFDISLDISFEEKMFALGYVTDFKYEDVLDFLINFSEYEKVRHFMKINLMMDEKIFLKIVENGNKEILTIKSLCDPLCEEKFENKIEKLDDRGFIFKEVVPEEKDDEEASSPEVDF